VQKMRPGGGLADVLQRGRGRWPRAGNASRIVVVDSGLHREPFIGPAFEPDPSARPRNDGGATARSTRWVFACAEAS
jgi:hypothetical protein